MRIAVIFGGESVEHEISIISALQAIEQLDVTKYDVVPVYISKKNQWYVGDVLTDITNYKDLEFVTSNAQRVCLLADGSKYYFYKYPLSTIGKKPLCEFDVAFPIVHGTNLEDGTLQGHLESLRIPYVGPHVSAAAVGQDKVLMKMIWQATDLPVVPYIWCYSVQWEKAKEMYVERLEKQFGFPMIIKPASLGSSVGISIVQDTASLIQAMDDATKYDDKIIVEQALTDFTEVNCSVIGNGAVAQSSVIEKVFNQDAILSYQDKYQGGSKGTKQTSGLKMSSSGTKQGTGGGMASTNREIPANLDDKITQKIQSLAELGFQSLGMSGVSRIDFLIDNQTNTVYLNEINTIPGSLSFYLWAESGKQFPQLLDELIQIAIERFHQKEQKIYSYETNILEQQQKGSLKGSKIK